MNSLALILMLAFCPAADSNAPKLTTADIYIRDPFVLPVASEKKYYLYGTSCHLPKWTGFDAYVSDDLKTWSAPVPVFRPEKGFWADRDFWAPEVHRYHDRYYMFASFNNAEGKRGTQILVADSPLGPFKIHSDGPVTPHDWGCLDGTLYIDKEQKPWIVFSHEWTQIIDGEICAMPLTDDLSKAAGPPTTLFKATAAPWVDSRKFGEHQGYITDGPFVFPAKSGALLMLWSSFTKEGYCLAVATSPSGALLGPWKQSSQPVYTNDGGHGMLFRTFDGTLMLNLHQPNKHPLERPHFFVVTELDNSLALAPWPAGLH